MHEDLTWLRAASDALHKAGFEAVSTLSGAGALHHVNEGFRPAVLVTAVRMAGIGGIELSNAIHDVSPETTVILVAQSTPAIDLTSVPSAVILTEPFAWTDLTARVRSIVHQHSNGRISEQPDHLMLERSRMGTGFDRVWSWIAAGLLISSALWLVIRMFSRPQP